MPAEPSPLYLDAAATTPPAPSVVAAISATQPGSEVPAARLAELLGVEASRIGWFASGSAANNAAVAVADALGATSVSQPTEHPSVLRALEAREARGARVVWLPVSPSGRVDPADLDEVLAQTAGPAVVSVMWANHETGAIQPVAELSAVCRARGALLHVDAVQAWRTLDVDPSLADLITLSAHKLNGPKGIGLLLRSERAPGLGGRLSEAPPALVAGLVAALELRAARGDGWVDAVGSSRDRLEAQLATLPRASAHGTEPRLASHLSISFPGLSGEALVLELDLRGIAASSGAACASLEGGGPSPVLLAMGRSKEVATGSLRISLAEPLGPEEVARVVEALGSACERLRRIANA